MSENEIKKSPYDKAKESVVSPPEVESEVPQEEVKEEALEESVEQEETPEVKPEIKQELDAVDPFGDDLEEEQVDESPIFEARHIEGNFVRGNEGVKRAPFPFKKRKVIDPDVPNTNIEQEAIITVRGTLQSVLASIESMDESVVSSEESMRWFELVQEATERSMLPLDQLFEATVRKGSMWVNMVNVAKEGDNPKHVGLTVDKSGVNPSNKNDAVSIMRAAMISSLGLGATDYVPLWHTGIWVKLRVPTAAELAALDESLVNDKIVYGNLTHGQIFSNDAAFFRKRVVDFVLNHVDWSTAPEGDDPDYLKSIIKTTDYDQLAWGMALARYPDGFDFAQPCTVNPKECQYVAEGRIDLRSLSFTDENKLTEKQKRIMNNPLRRISEEDLKAYQAEFDYGEHNRIILVNEEDNTEPELLEQGVVTNGVVINISVPTLEREENYAITWINELKRNAEEVFREKNDEKARNERIQQLVQRSNFKTHGQWVESIEIYRGGQMVGKAETEEAIDEMLELASGDIAYSEKFKQSIHKFMVENLLTIIGVVNYECPNCGKKHDTADGSHYLVLPINVNMVFFTLIRCAVNRNSQLTM